MAEQEKIDVIGITDVLGTAYSEYSKYIIQSRAIPDVRDGLKPVQRRILYSMYLNKLTSNKPFRKSAKTVGDVIGSLSPHGDSSVYEAMVRLSQEWKNNHPLVEIHGNKGSIDGDGAAAMRYTEARMGKLAETFFSGVDKKGVVPMKLNYDDTLEEPVVLPAQFPNVLVNGSSGISSGYATDIPTHNLAEVLKGCMYLLDNPDATLDEVIQIIPAPDFPTGGVIVGAKDLKKVYATGKGKIRLRSRYHVDTKTNKKRKLIIVTEIPFGVNKSKLVSDMDDIASSKKVAGLVEVRDETSRDGLRIVIECQKDADEKVILSYLFKNSELQNDFNMNLNVIHKNKPVQMGLVEVLNAFNEYRLETRRKELEYDLARLEERVHIVEGYIKLIDILDDVIQVIRASRGRKGSKEAIKKQFGFTEEQASAIVDLQLYRLSKEDKEKYENDKKKLDKLIGQLNKILTSKRGVIKNVLKQYEKIIKDYGVERNSEIVYEDENWDVSKVDVIKEEDCVVGVTSKGYVKRSSTRSYASSSECGLVEDDDLVAELNTTTKQYILLFTSKANYMYIPVHEIKDKRWGDVGIHLNALGVTLSEDESIVSAYVVTEDDYGKYVLIAKSNGQVKRTEVKEYEVTRRYFNLYTAIKLKGNEELIGAWIVEDEGYIGFIGKDKKAMYFPISDIAPKGLKTVGMAGIKATEDDYVTEVIFELNKEDIPKPYVERNRGQAGAKFR